MNRSSGSPCSGADSRALDRLLELLERDHHSATELRVLLDLLGRRDASIPELAQALVARPADIRPAARRLAMRGLIRSHHDEGSEQTLLAVTAAGLATLRALLAAAGEPAAASEAPGAPVR